MVNLNQLNYNELSKSKNPFADFLAIIKDHITAVKTSYEEDIEVQKKEIENLKKSIQTDFSIIKIQLDVNRESIEKLIEEVETKLSVLKRLYNEVKTIKLDYFDNIIREIENHIFTGENQIKTYNRIKGSFVSYDALSDEEKQKRLEGYNKAILHNIEVGETSISNYQHKIHELEDVLSKL